MKTKIEPQKLKTLKDCYIAMFEAHPEVDKKIFRKVYELHNSAVDNETYDDWMQTYQAATDICQDGSIETLTLIRGMYIDLYYRQENHLNTHQKQ